jgi:hypothetical protein
MTKLGASRKVEIHFNVQQLCGNNVYDCSLRMISLSYGRRKTTNSVKSGGITPRKCSEPDPNSNQECY